MTTTVARLTSTCLYSSHGETKQASKTAHRNSHVRFVMPDLVRVVVAIDPAASSGEDADETGIIVAGKDKDTARTLGACAGCGYSR